ncbi:MAG: 4-vinyl reductase [Thermoplasmata archaeon]|nr:4-vinyl reductase [Thermoplasmata archaeon]
MDGKAESANSSFAIIVDMGLTIEIPDEMAERFFESYRKEIWVDHESGMLRYKKVPIFWARSELLYNMHKEMVNLMGYSAGAIMERITRPHGGGFVAFLREEKAQVDMPREGILRLACADARATGWGKVRIEEGADSVEIISEKGFPIGQIYRDKGERTPMPVDYYFLGYFTGVFSALDNTPYRGEELECVAKGDPQCVFRLKKV